jgi:hypothetical protein
MANAQWLREQLHYHGERPRYLLNPYTDVDLLVGYLLQE